MPDGNVGRLLSLTHAMLFYAWIPLSLMLQAQKTNQLKYPTTGLYTQVSSNCICTYIVGTEHQPLFNCPPFPQIQFKDISAHMQVSLPHKSNSIQFNSISIQFKKEERTNQPDPGSTHEIAQRKIKKTG